MKRVGTYWGISRLPFRRPSLVVAAYLAVLVVAVVVTFSLAPTLKSGMQPDVTTPVQQSSTEVAVGGTQQPEITPLPSLTPDATATQYAADYATSREPYAYLDRSKYGKYIGISQGSGGYTVTVNWAYADGNLMLVDFDLAGPLPDALSGRHLTPQVVALSVRNGPDLTTPETRLSSKAGVNKIHYLLERDVANKLDKYGNQELEFDLTIALNAFETGPKSVATPTDSVATWTAGSQNTERVKEPNIAGPFNFSLRVPFIPARIARLLQNVIVRNFDVSLQQFRVSPAQVRSFVEVKSLGQAVTPADWEISAGAQVNNWDALKFRTGKPSYGQMLTSNLGTHTIYDNVYDEQGEWTFTVRRLLNNQTGEVIEGPWIFKFQVLPATPGADQWKLVEQSPIPSK
ncbi:MAG: hypothetical protein QOH93_3607 [Chloroflexia bacterium]|nr:hypothetical protein [Chloroflexia bacterium]